MMRARSAMLLMLLGASIGTSACALTSKAELVDTRYFTPERVKPAAEGTPRTTASRGNLELRLGRVTSGPSLRERITYRDAAYELGYYDDLRWTERPETFVRRGLGRALFEDRGVRRVLGGMAPTLDVEVTAFDDLRLASGRAVRVQLKLLLHEDVGVILEDTLTIERPVAGDKPKIEDVIAAMALALEAACEQVSLRVESALASKRPVAAEAGAK